MKKNTKEQEQKKPLNYERMGHNPLKLFMPGYIIKGNENERVYHRYLQFVKYKQVDVLYLMLLVVLCAIGLATMFSASYASSINVTRDHIGYYYAQRQAAFFIAGFAGIFVLQFIDYHVTRNVLINGLILGAGLALMVAVLVAGRADPEQAAIAGDDAGGATRWLYIFGIRFQPSELMKMSLIFALSRILSVNADKIGSKATYAEEFTVWFKCMALIGITAVLMYKQPHLSGMVIICLIGVCMMYVAGIRLPFMLVTVLGGGIGGIAIMLAKYAEGGYVYKRIEGWLHTWDPANADIAWQTRNSLIAIGSGGLWGLGFRNSRQKFLYLPEPHNDFIFSVICEELGIVTGIIIIILFVMLTIRGAWTALNALDRYGMLLSAGISLHFIIQVMLNVAVVSNAMPNTGISLPFFSYGGSAVLIQFLEAGMVLNISRQYFERQGIEQQKSAELIPVDRRKK